MSIPTELLGVISDVHADPGALRAALDQLDKLGCTQVICAGDLVSYGDQPEELVQLVIDRGIRCVKGNHDRWGARDGWDLNDRHKLSWPVKKFLRELPLKLEFTVQSVRVAIWHARPGDDMAGVFDNASGEELRRVMESAHADVLILGHTHKPMIVNVGKRRAIVNSGALYCGTGHGLRTGTYGVLELPAKKWRVYRVEDGFRVRGLKQRYIRDTTTDLFE